MTIHNENPEASDEYKEVLRLVEQAKDKAESFFNEGKFDLAEIFLRQILKVSTEGEFSTKHHLALCLNKMGKNDEARNILLDIIEECPEIDSSIYNTLGVIETMESNSQDAIKYYQKSLELCPENAVTLSNLALEFHHNDRYQEALDTIDHAIAFGEHLEHLYLVKANILGDHQRIDESLEYINKVLDINPSNLNAQWNYSNAYLIKGDFKEGWEKYDVRWQLFPSTHALQKRYSSKPMWKGESLKGKTIAIVCEQGAGDAIQFCRYLKKIKSLGAKIIFDWSSKSGCGDLTSLLRQLPEIDLIVDTTTTVVGRDFDCDYYQSILSLHRYLGINCYDDIELEPPYLVAQTQESKLDKNELWTQYADKFKVGIVWAGNAVHHNDFRRSLYLKDFETLATLPNVQLFSLQKDYRKRKWISRGVVDLIEHTAHIDLIDISEHLTDYNETAVAISKMDCVVTVDTSVAHLAGALGKRTYVIIPPATDWRWQLHGDTTRWYPTITLFRRNFNSNIHEIMEAIKNKIISDGAVVDPVVRNP